MILKILAIFLFCGDLDLLYQILWSRFSAVSKNVTLIIYMLMDNSILLNYGLIGKFLFMYVVNDVTNLWTLSFVCVYCTEFVIYNLFMTVIL